MARIDFDAARNKYAVYEGATSDGKLLNPLDNLPSIKWHSDLEYVGAVKTLRPTFNLDVRTWPGGAYDRALVAHGMSYRPLLLGSVAFGGHVVPAQGDFLVTMAGGTACSYNFYADATNIRVRAEPLQFTTFFKSIPCTATLHVCDVGMTANGNPVRKTRLTGIDISPDRFRAGYFDTNDQHFIASGSGNVVFYRGRSMDVGLGYGLENVPKMGFVQNVLGYSCTQADVAAGVEGGYFSGTNAAFQPVTVRTVAR